MSPGCFAALLEIRERRFDRAALTMAEHENQRHVQRRDRVFKSSRVPRGSMKLPATRTPKMLPGILIEKRFDRYARVSAAEDNCKGALPLRRFRGAAR